MLTIRKLEELGINPRLALPLALFIVVSLMVWALMASSTKVESQSTGARPMPIDAFAVQQQDIELKVHTQGTIEPRTQSDLVAEVAGIVNWVSPQFVAGGLFAPDDPLITLEADDYRTDLIRANAALARRNAEFQRAEREYKRITKLQAKKLASQAQLDNASSDYSVAEANLAEANANVNQSKRDIRRTKVKAPYQGMVRNKSIDLGQYVSRGTLIASVYATDYLEVRLPIADAELAFIEQSSLQGKEKPAVLLSADYAGVNTHWNGVIDRLEATIDTRSRMVFAVARLQTGNTQAPPVGLFVKAQIAGRVAESVMAIPRASLRDDNQVLVVNAKNVLESRTVRILRTEGDRIIVDAGLKHGDIVSTSLNPTLSPGSLVTPTVRNQQPELRLDEAPRGNEPTTKQ